MLQKRWILELHEENDILKKFQPFKVEGALLLNTYRAGDGGGNI